MFLNSTQETIILSLWTMCFTLFFCCIASSGILELYTLVVIYAVLIILITYLIYLGIKYKIHLKKAKQARKNRFILQKQYLN